jgi:hypothetical protein
MVSFRAARSADDANNSHKHETIWPRRFGSGAFSQCTVRAWVRLGQTWLREHKLVLARRRAAHSRTAEPETFMKPSFRVSETGTSPADMSGEKPSQGASMRALAAALDGAGAAGPPYKTSAAGSVSREGS